MIPPPPPSSLHHFALKARRGNIGSIKKNFLYRPLLPLLIQQLIKQRPCTNETLLHSVVRNFRPEHTYSEIPAISGTASATHNLRGFILNIRESSVVFLLFENHLFYVYIN